MSDFSPPLSFGFPHSEASSDARTFGPLAPLHRAALVRIAGPCGNFLPMGAAASPAPPLLRQWNERYAKFSLSLSLKLFFISLSTYSSVRMAEGAPYQRRS